MKIRLNNKNILQLNVFNGKMPSYGRKVVQKY